MIKIKKGGLSLLQSIISILIVAVILAIVLNTINKSVTHDKDIKEARLSLLSKVSTYSEGDVILIPLFKTNQIVFYNNKIMMNGKKMRLLDSQKQEFVSNFKSMTDEFFSMALAQTMHDCWYQFIEGREALIKYSNPEADITVCYLCDNITFDNALSDKEFKGFYNYLNSRKIKNTEDTYFNYIAEGDNKCEHVIYNEEGMTCWHSFFEKEIVPAVEVGKEFSLEDQSFKKAEEPYQVIFLSHFSNLKTTNAVYVLPESLASKQEVCGVVKKGQKNG